ncbi:MAG: alpha/beta fold hydrolase, partial [Oscillospiraceae bacterium]|nr:alpha/beta fold hydrolase [Oscillospiraceae bacterium]
MGKNKKLTVILAISLVLMLVSCIFTSMIQTNFGKVEVKEINWVTDKGYSMNAWVFIPENATAETPAPAVVTSHGMFNNKGMQDLNFVELARRGFVVLAQDMPSHGDSDDSDGFAGTMMGMYESVKVLAKMPFVDAARIGITGHSLGGMSCNLSITLDNYSPTPLIAAVLLNSADGEYTADGQFANIYGARDMGIVAGQYDEWFFDDTDANGNPTLPKDFIFNKNAQSILYFGQDPAGKPLREANT